tara:strand:+ start:49 stop:567 length:519 start_codon:yes stop_codon:yes gene_type:complete
MTWNTAANQSLGVLGNLAAGNGNNTSETSLNDCARDSGTGETEMWADFRPGDGAISVERDGGSDGNGRGYHQIIVTGNTGTWANGGGTSAANITRESSLDVGLNDTADYHDIVELTKNSAGSLWKSRIVTANHGDFAGDFRLDGASAVVVDYTYNDDPDSDGSKDKFRTTAI